MDESKFKSLFTLEELDKAPKVTLNRVRSLLLKTTDIIEKKVYIAEVVDVKNGIPKYLSSAVRCKTPQQTIKDAFEVMTLAIQSSPRDELLPMQKLLVWCFGLLPLESSTAAKMFAVDLATSTVDMCLVEKVDWPAIFIKIKPYIDEDDRCSANLKASLLKFFGLFFKKMSIIPNLGQIFKWYCDKILGILKNYEKSDAVLLNAACGGLSGIFAHPPPEVQLSAIYPILSNLCRKKKVARQALGLFPSMVHYFSLSVLADHEIWYELLAKWTRADCLDDRELGLTCLSSLFGILARKSDERTDYSEFLRSIISTPPAGVYGTKIALCSLIEFAKARICNGHKEDIFQQAEVLVNRVANDDNLFTMLLRFKALSLAYMAEGDSHHFQLAQQTILLFESIPNIAGKHHSDVFNCLYDVLCHLIWANTPAMLLQLDEVIYQLLLHSSALAIYSDAKLLKETEVYHSIFAHSLRYEFWVFILTPNSSNVVLSQEAKQALYNAFVLNVIKLITTFDLSLVVVNPELTDLSMSMEAKCRHDFQLFGNLTDIITHVVRICDVSVLITWIPEILSLCINNCKKSPSISGFYKIIAAFFGRAKEYNILSLNIPGLSDFVGFSLVYMNSQNNDLLISILNMILSAPISMLGDSHHLLGNAIHLACQMGRSCPSMFQTCIDALDRWFCDMALDKAIPILTDSLPPLSAAIMIPAQEFSTNVPRLGGKANDKVLSNSAVLNLQRNFLMLLSKLEPAVSVRSFKPVPVETSRVVLRYRLPMPDTQLNLDIGLLVPRAIQLATSCVDRNLRFSACQLVHSVVLLYLGQLDVSLSESDGSNSFETLISASLTLSCDPDVLVGDLFQPLIVQIVHFLSDSRFIHTITVAGLVDALFVGASHLSNPSKRDFAAKCIKEFVMWSKTQQDFATQKIAKYNVNGMVRKICDFAAHPHLAKRQAAALVFIQLHDHIREERETVSKYWLQLHKLFANHLKSRLSEHDNDVLTSTVIKKIYQCFIEKHDLFSDCSDPDRVIPPEYGNGCFIDVASVSLQHCKSGNASLRKESQEFIKTIINQIPCLSILQHKCVPSVTLVNFHQYSPNDRIGVIHFINFQCATKLVSDITQFKGLDEAVVGLIEMFAVGEFGTSSDVNVVLDAVHNYQIYPIQIVTALSKFVSQGRLDLPHSLVYVLRHIRNVPTLYDHWLSCSPTFSMEEFITILLTNNPTVICRFWSASKYLQMAEMIPTWRNVISKVIFPKILIHKGESVELRKLDERIYSCFHSILKFYFLDGAESIDILIAHLTEGLEIQQTTRGQLLFHKFRETLVPCLLKEVNIVPVLLQKSDYGLSFIFKILQCLATNRASAHLTSSFVKGIVENIGMIKGKLNLLLKISEIMPKLEVSDELRKNFYYLGHPTESKSQKEIIDWFKMLSYYAKQEESDLLYESLTYMGKEMQLQDASTATAATHLEFSKKTIMDHLQQAIMHETNFKVFLYFVETLDRNPSLVTEEKINSFGETLSRERDNAAIAHFLDVLHVHLFGDDSLDNNILAIFTIAILKNCSMEIVETFFFRYIMQLKRVLVSAVPENNFRVKRDLIRRTVAVDLLHVLFFRTTTENRQDLQRKWTLLDTEKKNIFPSILKVCCIGSLKLSTSDQQHIELLRRYNCACVNFMCKFACSLPNEEMHAKVLLVKNLWTSVIDDVHEYSLGIDSTPEMKIIPTSIERNDTSQESTSVIGLKYARSASSTLSSCSLSARWLDMSNVTITTESSIRQSSSYMNVHLKIDQLNNHEIMPTLCAFLRYLVNKNMMKWTDYFVDSLQNASKNSRLFVLKVFSNLHSDGVIKSKNVYEIIGTAILNSIMELFHVPNGFMLDLIQMLLDWKPSLSGCNEKMLQLIKMFIEPPNSHRRSQVRHATKVLRNVIETFCYLLDANELTNTIHDLIKDYDGHSDETNYKYLHITSIFLTHNLLKVENKDIFSVVLNWIFKCLKRAKNHQLAAETLGQLLDFVSKRSDVEVDMCFIKKTLEKVPNFLNSLFFVSKFFSKICHLFHKDVEMGAWNERSVIRGRCLNMILLYVNQYSQFADVDMAKYFPKLVIDCLENSLLSSQIPALRISAAAVHLFDDFGLQDLVNYIIPFCRHPVIDIRLLVMEVLIKVLIRYWGRNEDIAAKCAMALIRGVNDCNGAIRNRCLKFWSEQLQSPKSANMMLLVLQNMYYADVEEEFVTSAVRVLLMWPSTGGTFEKYICGPLKKCDFKEQPMNFSLRSEHIMDAELYAPSLCNELRRLHQPDQPDNTLSAHIWGTKNSLVITSSTQATETTLNNADLKKTVDQFEPSVTIFRKYRTGDYPDTQITHSELAAMLTSIASMDKLFAQQLFLEFFRAIADPAKNSNFISKVEQDLVAIIQCSYARDPPTVNTFFQIIIENDLSVPLEKICELAITAGNLLTGAIVLEKLIERAGNEHGSTRQNEWLQLARVYKKMKDNMAVEAIFDEALVDNRVSDGALAESMGDWKTALNLYGKGCSDQLASESLRQYCCERSLECLEQLSDWGALEDWWSETYRDNWHCKTYNHSLLRAKFIVANSLTSFLGEFDKLVIDEKEVKLNSRFTELQPIADVLKNDWGKSMRSSYFFLQNFITDWITVDKWDIQQKCTLIDKIAIVTDLQKIVESQPLCKVNILNPINACSNLAVWNVKITLQCMLDEFAFPQDWRAVTAGGLYSCAVSSLEQNNKSLAKKVLKKIVCLNLADYCPDFRIMNTLLSGLGECKDASVSSKLVSVRNDCQVIESLVIENSIDEKLKLFAYSLLTDLTKEILELKLQMKSVSPRDDDDFNELRHQQNVLHLIECSSDNRIKGRNYLNSAKFFLFAGNDQLLGAKHLLKSIQFGQIKTARPLIGLILNMNVESESDIGKECEKVPTWVFLNWRQQLMASLRDPTMKLSRQILKRIAKEYPNSLTYILRLSKLSIPRSDSFVTELSASVLKPSEEMLIAQVGLLTNPFQKLQYTFQHINDCLNEQSIELNNIREHIEEAILIKNNATSLVNYQVFKLVKENYEQLLQIDDPNILSVEVNKILKELKCLKNPDHVLNQIIDDLERCLNFQFDYHKIQAATRKLQDLVEYGDKIEYYRPFHYLRTGVNILSTHFGSSIPPDDATGKIVLRNAIQKFKELPTINGKTLKFSRSLEHFSKWLSRYHLRCEAQLEIPGQYEVHIESYPAHHVFISSFKSPVQFLPSKRQLVKLSMIGNNGKDYSFLVKFGEDLRQDARIQQVLGCVQELLSTPEVLVGYAVIPLTRSYGLIQWLESSKSLMQFINESDAAESITELNEKVIGKYLKFHDPRGTLSPIDAIRRGCVVHSDEALVAKYNDNVRAFNKNLLRNSFWRISASPQHFYWLRSNFAVSLAAKNVTLWVLGVGDRHLDNILVSTSTGRAVGVDFGMAFGFATQCLALPEMVPFRLTPQILNVFGPMRESGWIKQTMVDTLTDIRNNSDLLLAMLQIFITEPCLDSFQVVRNSVKQQMQLSGMPHKISWADKIEAVRKKLRGENPVVSYETDTQIGKNQDEFLKRLLIILQGCNRKRHTLPRENLSPKHQVDILVDLATNPLIMSVIWVGWTPWL